MSERSDEENETWEQAPALFCLRCGARLTPGAGDFYIVRIEAFADPYPPVLDNEMSREEIAAEVNELIRAAENEPESSLMDQVYRRMTIHLCWPCYRGWIENPAGGGALV